MEIIKNPDPRFTGDIIRSLPEAEAIALYMEHLCNDPVEAKIFYYDFMDRLDELIATDPEVAARFAQAKAEIEREYAIR